MGLQIKEILAVADNILSEAGINESKIDAQLILSYVISYDERRIFMNWAKEIEYDHAELFFELIQQRAAGRPTQYITQSQNIMEYVFHVDERVLIPRMDTEVVIEAVLKYMNENKGIQRVLDLCTGSGVIAICLAKKAPSLKITATDIDADALDVAAGNATRHKVESKVKFLQSDLFSEINMKFGSKKFDLIVSNPPYIRTKAISTLQREIIEYEPIQALDGGEDGLDYYREIVQDAPDFLTKGGALFFEIGYDQADAISALIEETNKYGMITVLKDLAGNDRVLFTKLKNKK